MKLSCYPKSGSEISRNKFQKQIPQINEFTHAYFKSFGTEQMKNMEQVFIFPL